MASPAFGVLDPVQVAVLSAAAATAFVLTLRELVASLHALQQDDYSNLRFARWLGAAKTRLIHGRIAMVYVAGGLLLVALSTAATEYWVPALTSCVAVLVTVKSLKRPPQKKPLVYTGRARRLLIVSAALAALLFALGFLVFSRLATSAGLAAASVPGLAVLVIGRASWRGR